MVHIVKQRNLHISYLLLEESMIHGANTLQTTEDNHPMKYIYQEVKAYWSKV